MNRQAKRIAIITGASSGLGAEYARQLAVHDDVRAAGLDEFWLIARREDRLHQLAKTLRLPSRVLALDLSTNEGLEQVKRELETQQPEVLFLINSAGFGKTAAFADIDIEVHQRMIRLNIEATTLLCQLVLPYLVKGSRILNIASVGGFMPQTHFNVYSASKAYVISFSRALNDELKARGIHVTAVCPGPMETEFFDVTSDGQKEQTERALYTRKIKDLGLEDPQKVVALTLRKSLKGKDMVVTSLVGKLLLFVSRIMPHRFVLWVEHKMGM